MPEGTAMPRFGQVERFGEVGSTNQVLADMARLGADDGRVVVADHQTAGRGRRGRRWIAPPGSSLLVSVLLRPPRSTGPAHLATLAMALAAAEACADVAGVRPRLKWPNDIVVSERKVGGVLGEATAGATVVGLGLNVNWGGEVPPPPGVALDELAGGPVDRDRLLDALLGRLEQALDLDPHDLVGWYRRESATLGRRVSAETGAGTVEGDAVDLTDEGHLVVDDGRSRHVLAAGDVVHVRTPGPFEG